MDPEFDRLKELALSSPAEFEKARITLINEMVRLHHNASRAQGAQWRIDMEAARSKSSLGTCVRLNSLMWEEIHKLDDELQRLLEELQQAKRIAVSLSNATQVSGNTATILPFNKPHHGCS